jgi:hypothetical protein
MNENELINLNHDINEIDNMMKVSHEWNWSNDEIL